MGATSNESKQRWNAANYTQVNISLPQEIASGFKAKCSSAGVSMRSEIERFMSGSTPSLAMSYPLTTRRGRRKAVKKAEQLIEAIIAAEAAYLENIPENLTNSKCYATAEDTLSALEEALNILGEAYQ